MPREGGPEQTSHKSQLGADLKLNSDLGLIQDINNPQLNCVSLMEAGDGIWVVLSDLKMIKRHCVYLAGKSSLRHGKRWAELSQAGRGGEVGYQPGMEFNFNQNYHGCISIL